MPNQSLSKPTLLFDLGRLQVYHYPTEAELRANAAPTKVYWQDRIMGRAFGPFDSTYAAMTNYTWMLTNHKQDVMKLAVAPDIKDKVIYMDFRAKKRISSSFP